MLKYLKGKLHYKVECHNESLTGCDIHPLGNLFTVSSMDGKFSFHDITEGK